MKKLFVLSMFFAIAIDCSAATITVNWDGSADYTTIQPAINAANDFDTVIVAEGTHTGAGNRDIDFLGKAITVKSAHGPENCIIDPNGTEAYLHRGFYFHNNEDANSILEGFTIRDGYADKGAGVYCLDSSPKITQCIIIENNIQGGGGMDYNPYGGGIHLENSNAVISYCHIGKNMGGTGGGICCYSSSPEITNCFITDNRAKGCSINCGMFSSVPAGGGIACLGSGSSPVIRNCTIVNNICFAPRSHTHLGVGIYQASSGGESTVINCVIWDNVGKSSDPLSQAYPYTAMIEISYSNVQYGWLWGEGNISAAPNFVEPGYWDGLFLCYPGDYHLRPISPSINAGDPNYSDEPDETDMDGEPRLLYGRVDMGADEVFPIAGDVEPDEDIDSADFGKFGNYWLQSGCGECGGVDFTGDGNVWLDDLMALLRNWLVGIDGSDLLPGAGINYQIEDCDLAKAAGPDKDGLRFSATAQGNYILFEDMMVANCCPDDIWLEMEIEGNQITIYEYAPGGVCFCMCDWPVTATLGPFNVGFYIIDVYGNPGGFIGSTIVTIE